MTYTDESILFELRLGALNTLAAQTQATMLLRRFENSDKGDALYMMELVLSLEKLNFQKLRLLHDIACKHDDAEFADFLEGTLLAPQSQSVKEVAEYVSQLRRVGKGLGVYEFDQKLAGLVRIFLVTAPARYRMLGVTSLI